MTRDQLRIALAVLAVLALAGLGVGLAALVGDNEKSASGSTTLCARAEVPPASSESCVLYPSGETVTGTVPTLPTTTEPPPPTETVPVDTPVPNPDDFKLSPCTPSSTAGHVVVCKTNSPQSYRLVCGTTYDLVQLIVEENAAGASKDAAFMPGACSKETIVRRLEIRNEQCDGLKQAGTNVTIEGGFVDLPRLRPPFEPGGLDCHVDAFQLGCSKNVTVENMAIRGWGHSGFFVNCEDASEATGGHDVILKNSYVMKSPEGPQPFDTDVTIGDSDSTGVVGSTLCTALQWEIYIPKTPSTGGDQARNPVVEDNTVEESSPVQGCSETTG